MGRAVEALKNGKVADLDKPLNAGVEINLHVPALLPEDYVPDVHLRLILYKRISGAASRDELREMQVELIDRFGLLPDPAKNLMRIAAIKRDASLLGVEKIDASNGGGYLDFASETTMDPVTLVQMLQNESQVYRMQGAHRLQFRIDLGDTAVRFTEVEKLLDRLASGGVKTTATG